jgi:hypothetical protein
MLIALSVTAVASGTASNPANGATVHMTQRSAATTMGTSSATTPAQRTDATTADQEMARKAAIKVSLWLTLSLLAGAFGASWMATCGGKLRDRAVPTV